MGYDVTGAIMGSGGAAQQQPSSSNPYDVGGAIGYGAKAPAPSVGHGIGNVVGDILKGLDMPRAILVGEGRQLEHLATGQGWDSNQLHQDVANHVGIQQLLNNNGVTGWPSRVAGFLGDVATDPTTYLTLGTGKAAELGAKGVLSAIADKATENAAAHAALGEGASAAAHAAIDAANPLTKETFARVAQQGTRALQPPERAALADLAYKPGGLYLRMPFTRLASHVTGGTEAAVPLLPHAATDAISRATNPMWRYLADSKIGGMVSSRIQNLPELKNATVRSALRSGDPQQALDAWHTLQAAPLFHEIPQGMRTQIGPKVAAALAPFHSANASTLGDLRNALEGDTGAAARLAEQGLSHQPVRDVLNQIRDTANAHGADIKELTDYYPHVLTPEGRALLEKADGRLPGASKVGAEQTRQYAPGRSEFLGQKVQTGTVDELHQIARDVLGTGTATKLFEEDPRQAILRYFDNTTRASGRAAFAQELARRGVVAPYDAKLAEAARKAEPGTLKAVKEGHAARALLGAVEDIRGEATAPAETVAARDAAAAELRKAQGQLKAATTRAEASHVAQRDQLAAEHAALSTAPAKGAPTAEQAAEGKKILDGLRTVEQRLAALREAGVHEGTLADMGKRGEALTKEAGRLAQGGRYVSHREGGASSLDEATSRRLAEINAERQHLNDSATEFRRLSEIKAKLQEQARAVMAEAKGGAPSGAAARAARLDELTRRLAAERVPSATEAKWSAKVQELHEVFDQAQRAVMEAGGAHPENLVRALDNQARIAEAQIAKSDAKLATIERKGLWIKDGQVAKDASAALRDGWRVLGGEAGAKLAGKQAPEWLTEALKTVPKVADPQGFQKFLTKYFDPLQSRWKSYQLLTPGKAIRHQLGAFFNAYLGNVKLSSYDAWHRLWSASKQGQDLSALAPRDRELMQAYIEHGVAHNSQFTEDEITAPSRMAQSKLNPLSQDFAPLRANRNIQNRAQDFVRGSMFYDAVRRQGLSYGDAAEKVRTFLFDFTGLSEWERNFARRLVPFYTFTRKNFPLMLQQMVLQPGKFAAYTHLATAIGGTPTSRLPDYWGQTMQIVLPFKLQGQDSSVGVDLPFTRMGQEFGGGPNQLLSMLTPAITLPVQTWANKSLYSGLPFKQGLQPVPGHWQDVPFLMPALEAVGLAKRAEGSGSGRTPGEWLMTQGNANAVASAIPFLGQMMRLVPSTPNYQQRVVASWLTWLTGQRFETNTASIQQAQAKADRDRASQQRALLRQLGVLPAAG